MDTLPHIAVVDDHQEIRELVARYLEQHGYQVTEGESAAAFLKLLETEVFDLVVLDIMMPGKDGFSLCRELRQFTQLPVIFLTAVAEDADRIIGLEIGADDYLTKPFNPRELLARIRAVLRRSQAGSQENRITVEHGTKLRFEDRVLDVTRQEVTGDDGVSIPLSSAEFRLLSVFLEHPGKVLSRDELLDLTSGREADVWDRSIDNQVSRLRKKIELDPKSPSLIKTFWGDGYCFTGTVSRA
ncbi:response regulator [Luteolibacter pohnpeiensis]|uniref:Response regulator n=1 Tax=Luteolibacter pohnpeiensis TaxID=454153 RepID=A0A934SDF6_9BACT|nr:response regulator [Luteolibacter pohnpeiensis]MBK1883203.1 response regulator [Luteolibacter pohnpeiensis]